MGKHDKGAFGQLLDEAKSMSLNRVSFRVELDADEDLNRWEASCFAGDMDHCASGRTGEEALRSLLAVLKRG